MGIKDNKEEPEYIKENEEIFFSPQKIEKKK